MNFNVHYTEISKFLLTKVSNDIATILINKMIVPINKSFIQTILDITTTIRERD